MENYKDIHPWYTYAECGCRFCVNVQRAVARRERRARKTRWTSKRSRIYKRDGNKCLLCGSEENLTLDHAVPKSLGGNSTDENLQTMCKPCNNTKGATTAFYAPALVKKQKAKQAY